MNTDQLLNSFPADITFQELYSRASSLAADLNFDEAEEIFQFLVSNRDKIHPHFIGASFFKLGEIAKNMKRLEQAELYFSNCLEYNPRHIRAAAYLGRNCDVLSAWEGLRKEILAFPGFIPLNTIDKIDTLYKKNFLINEDQKEETELLILNLCRYLESEQQFQLSMKTAQLFLKLFINSKHLAIYIKALVLKKPNYTITGEFLVSIIIPYYNGHDTVKETLDSISNQTYRNIEILIVDNGSMESSRQKLEALLMKYKNLSIRILDVEQRCRGPRRNLAVNNSNGDFFLPLDCDDQIAPGYIEETVSAFEENNSLDVVYTSTIIYGYINGLYVIRDFSVPEIYKRNLLNVTALIKKKSFLKVGGYREELPGYEDWDLWIRFAQEGMRFKLIPEPYFFYRKSQVSRGFLSQHKDCEKRLALIERNPGIYRLPDTSEIPILEQNSQYIPAMFLGSQSEVPKFPGNG